MLAMADRGAPPVAIRRAVEEACGQEPGSKNRSKVFSAWQRAPAWSVKLGCQQGFSLTRVTREPRPTMTRKCSARPFRSSIHAASLARWSATDSCSSSILANQCWVSASLDCCSDWTVDVSAATCPSLSVKDFRSSYTSDRVAS